MFPGLKCWVFRSMLSLLESINEGCKPCNHFQYEFNALNALYQEAIFCILNHTHSAISADSNTVISSYF